MKTFIPVICVLAVTSAAPTNWLAAFLPPEDYLSSANAQAAKAKPANPIPVLKAKPGYPSGLYPGPTPTPGNPSLPVSISNRNQISTPVEQPAPATAGNGLDWANLIGLASQNWGNQNWFSGFLPPENYQVQKTQPSNPVASYPAPTPTPAVAVAPAYQPAPVRQSTGTQESGTVEQAAPSTTGNGLDWLNLIALASQDWGNQNWISGFLTPENAQVEKAQPSKPVASYPAPAPTPAVVAAPAYQPAPVRQSTGTQESAPVEEAAPATAGNPFDWTVLMAMMQPAYWGNSNWLSGFQNFLPPANVQAEKVQPVNPIPVPAPSPAIIDVPAYEPAPVRESSENLVSAPLVQASPATSGNVFDLKSLMAMGGDALSKSTESFNSLMKGLPTALQNIDPSIKSDVGKVNGIIAQVCSQIVETGSGSEPTTFSYFSAEGLKSTCDYINRVAKQIEAGLEDPEVTQYYVDAINKPIKALQEQAKIYSV